jgi:hypothetical protein
MNGANDPWIHGSDRHPASGAGLDRRRFLSTAAGGFAFAATGLLLPEQLVEETAADDHPVRRVQGRKDGQRGQRRRRLEHRRAVNRRRDENTDSPPARCLFCVRGISFLVAVSGQFSIKGDLYVPRDRRGRPDFWDLKESKSVAPATEGSFSSTSPQAALWLDDRILVDANNWDLFPRLKIGSGGAFWAGERGWEGGTVLFNDAMTENAMTPAFALDGYAVRVARLEDDDDHKRFSVVISRL